MSRPCNELKKEIASIKKNIQQIKKDLNDPKYQDPEQQKTLLFRLKGTREQLVEIFDHASKCNFDTAVDECNTLKHEITLLAKINILDIQNNKDELEKYFEKEDAINNTLQKILRSIGSMDDNEEQLAVMQLCFTKLFKPDDESYLDTYIKMILSIMKELRRICLFNITQSEYEIDVSPWQELEKEINFFIKRYADQG